MANKKHFRKFGVNESLTARVADVGIIILHNSPKAVICSLLQLFSTNQTLNATNAKITYLCNRFGHWGRLINKYLQTYKKMCGVRCTPNLAAYCNNGLNLTSRGGGVIFKLLHKLWFFLIPFIVSVFNAHRIKR